MLSSLVLISLLTTSLSRREVAVILGGAGNTSVEPVEIFTDREESCVEGLQLWSTLFSYPGPQHHAAGVYLDNDGIYVCGGAPPLQSYETSCQCHQSPELQWSKIDYNQTLGVILDSAIVPWQGNGFIQTGGMSSDALSFYNDTYLYSSEDDTLSHDVDKQLDQARAGHCFVRVSTVGGEGGDGDLYIVLGGIGLPPGSSFLTYLHCQDLACQDLAWQEAAVEDLAPLDLTDRNQHSCTVLREQEREAVLIVDRNITFIMDFDCQQLSCTFSLRTYHEMLVWEEFSTTTTLDGVPFLLTERLVWRYVNQSWEFAGQLTHPRTSPVILSVPEDWLCFGSFSTTTTPASVTSDPACPEVGECRAEDGRGETWEAEFWSWASRPCGGSMSGSAVWFCDGCLGTFSGPQPDRVQCVEPWVSDLQAQVQDPGVSSTEISRNILNNLHNQTGPGLTGGSIVSLLGQYGGILDKREREGREEGDGEGFASNMLAATSDVIDLQVGWNEIPDENLRYQTSSSVLTFIDVLGYQHLQEQRVGRSQCVGEDGMLQSENIQLKLHTGDKGESSFCFDFGGGRGKICIAQSAVEDDCPTYVSSQLSLDNERSSLFPTPEGDVLGSHLIGLTLNNGTLNIDSSESEDIEITFYHEGSQVVVDWIVELSGD